MSIAPEIKTTPSKKDLLFNLRREQKDPTTTAETNKDKVKTPSHPLRAALGRITGVALIVGGLALGAFAYRTYLQNIESADSFNFVDETWNRQVLVSPAKKRILNGNGAETGSPYRFDKPIEKAIEVGDNPVKIAVKLAVNQIKDGQDYSGGLTISNTQPLGPSFRQIILENGSDKEKVIWELKYKKGQYDDFETIFLDNDYYLAETNSTSQTFLIGLDKDGQTGSIVMPQQAIEKSFKLYESIFDGNGQKAIQTGIRATPNTETVISRLEVYTPKAEGQK